MLDHDDDSLKEKNLSAVALVYISSDAYTERERLGWLLFIWHPRAQLDIECLMRRERRRKATASQLTPEVNLQAVCACRTSLLSN